MINISLLGAGYWGEKVAAELKNIKEVNNIEIIDIKNGKDIKDIQYNNVIIATPALDHYEQSINLLKQGKYTPGGAVPIVSRDYLDQLTVKDKILFVPLAWNVFEESRQKITVRRLTSNDRFLLYLPEVKVEY